MRARAFVAPVVAGTAALFSLAMASSALATAPAPGADVEITGVVREIHGESYANGHVREVDERFTVDTADGPVPLDVAGGGHHLALGRQTRLRGHMDGRTFVVAANGATPTGGGATVAAATGSKTVAVILFNFTNDTSQPWTPSQVQGVVFDNPDSVNAYYQDASDGQTSMTGAVFGWYPIAMDNSGCDYNGWATAARNAATNSGVNLNAYQYVVYAFPSTSSCGWAGLGYLPGSGAWINGSMNLRVVAHELGHNFGVHHASSESCTDATVRVTLSATASNCSSSEYGDPFTVMGSASTRMHNNWHRAQLGWLPGTTTITTSGDYALAPADSAGSASPRLLRIARSDGTYFQFEFRQPTGIFDNFSASDPAVNGITIRIAPDTSTITQSQLLDATPETTSFNDAPLPVGRTFVDPVSGISVTTKSVASTGALMTVQFSPDTQPPTTPTNFKATANSPSAVALSWTASTDNVGVVGYRISRDNALVTTVTSTAYTDTGLTANTTYAYSVQAVDAAGNPSGAATAGATTVALDTTPPSAPGTLTATVAKSGTTIKWGAATDNVAVAGYRVYRNGALAATLSATTRSWLDKPRKGTSTTYSVVAYDAAGNVGASSNSVTVKT